MNYNKQQVGKGYDEEGNVVYYQKLELPEINEQERLESLPYIVIAAGNDPEYIIGKFGDWSIEKCLGIRPELLNHYRKQRLLLSQIDGFHDFPVDMGLCYGAETLVEAFRIVRKIYEIEKQFLPKLHPNGDCIEILWDIAIQPKNDWFCVYGFWTHQWLNHIDNWPKIRYDYAIEKILSTGKKNNGEKLDILSRLFNETTQEAEIRELFAQEIRIIQEGFRTGRFKH